MDADEAYKIAKTIPGWLSRKEGHLLYKLAKSCRNRGVIVEIGSFKGRSTVLLGLGSKAGYGVKVYAIDPHIYDMDVVTRSIPKQNRGTLEPFLKNIKNAGLESIVTPLNVISEKAIKNVKEPVELLFIDGDHEYSGVKKDYKLWFPKLISGGVIAFHDNKLDGPQKVITEFLTPNRFNGIKTVELITYGIKQN